MEMHGTNLPNFSVVVTYDTSKIYSICADGTPDQTQLFIQSTTPARSDASRIDRRTNATQQQYTHLDFLPRFLMEEFHPRRKMANAYFLVLASLQTIPEITNTFRVPTILLPLSVVVIVDAVFAILEVREAATVGRGVKRYMHT